jgi:hypothetical protein
MSWIEDRTNRSDEYWVGRVQQLIISNTILKDDGHGDTDSKWIHKLCDEIENSLPPETDYDGNMRMAAILGYIFSLWYSSTHLAKTFDSHRPVYTRQKAYGMLQDWKHGVFDLLTNISKHPAYYPGQPWQHPFDPDAKGGDFL